MGAQYNFLDKSIRMSLDNLVCFFDEKNKQNYPLLFSNTHPGFSLDILKKESQMAISYKDDSPILRF